MAKIDDSLKKKVPELRFKGFTDDWEERKLGELSNIVGGGTPSTSNSEYWDGDIDWYAPAEIGEQRYVSKSKKTITELGLKKSSARILPVGTVLFTSRAGIGNTAILGKEATTNQGFQSIVPNPNKLDSYFIYSRTNELKRYGEVTGAGSTFVEVSGKQMSKMSIMVPELSEQEKIGSFFEQLDNTIALHQRKLDLLKEQKKGYLQKMFPKNGEKVPELRFAGFADDWEERKLEELGNLNRGKSKHRPRNDSRLFGGEYPFIQTGDVAKAPLFLTEYSQTYSEFGIQQSKLWDIGTLLITIAANVADTTILGIKAAFPDSVIGFESTSCDVVFIKNYIDTKSDLLKRKAETSSQANLNLAKLKEMNLNVPKLKEQQKIGSFFKQLDDTIALHQRKLDLLKEQKKGFLQKMFV
ncbi:restriction endonuclease subunit S [Lactococcus lactis]|uniref:restriction endonuclease subunit S n=1 Tax=Lactococcus lactis TaxID=1358 RepID=UPI0021AF1621|nr:restriction endonuclease subunit S [Lactococcus lactis]MCT1184078.1 restriction endonuclease subunit S [Lactococcus lactis]